MPIIKAAKKALRQNRKRKEENIRNKKAVKELIKDLNELLNKLEKSADKSDKENIKNIYELLSKTYKAIDKAAKKGIIKKNTAARKKSKLAKRISKVEKSK